ncbi:hypothetical protein PFISCL1PPCAC_260, partial [Pristionchus fissidentatus]
RSIILTMKRSSAFYLIGVLWSCTLVYKWRGTYNNSSTYFQFNTPKIGARFNLMPFTMSNGAVLRKLLLKDRSLWRLRRLACHA